MKTNKLVAYMSFMMYIIIALMFTFVTIRFSSILTWGQFFTALGVWCTMASVTTVAMFVCNDDDIVKIIEGDCEEV